MDSSLSSSTKPLYRGTQVVWYLLGIVEVLLAGRFLLRLLAANPEAGFTQFVYMLSYPFAAPFLSVFRIAQIQGSIIEWTTLLAMVVYWALAVAIVRMFLMGKSVSTPEAARKLDKQEAV